MKDRTRSVATAHAAVIDARTGAGPCSSLKCSPFPFGRTLACSLVDLGPPTSTWSAGTLDPSMRNFL